MVDRLAYNSRLYIVHINESLFGKVMFIIRKCQFSRLNINIRVKQCTHIFIPNDDAWMRIEIHYLNTKCCNFQLYNVTRTFQIDCWWIDFQWKCNKEIDILRLSVNDSATSEAVFVNCWPLWVLRFNAWIIFVLDLQLCYWVRFLIEFIK